MMYISDEAKEIINRYSIVVTYKGIDFDMLPNDDWYYKVVNSYSSFEGWSESTDFYYKGFKKLRQILKVETYPNHHIELYIM